jgi:heme exporter protein B
MGLFALLVIVVLGVAVAQSTRAEELQQLAGGLIWVLIVFTALLGLNRSFAYERQNDVLDGILLVPMDRSVIFLAKATSNLIFLVIVEIIALVLFAFLILSGTDIAPTWPLAAWPLLAGTIGIAGVGTLLATITAQTKAKDVLLAVLFIPVIFPLLYACVAATTICLTGSTDIMATYTPSLALACAYDVIMTTLAWFLYDYVISV